MRRSTAHLHTLSDLCDFGMSYFRGPDGLEVVPIVLDGHPRFRIDRWHGDKRWWVADCRDSAEVAQLVDLADLAEIFDFPADAAGRART
ncbi:hypothetical protein [Nonomuraea sp. NPDC003754]